MPLPLFEVRQAPERHAERARARPRLRSGVFRSRKRMAGTLLLFVLLPCFASAPLPGGEPDPETEIRAETQEGLRAQRRLRSPHRRVVLLTLDERNHTGDFRGFSGGFLLLRQGEELRRFSPASVLGILPLEPGAEAPLPVDPDWREARRAELVGEYGPERSEPGDLQERIRAYMEAPVPPQAAEQARDFSRAVRESLAIAREAAGTPAGDSIRERFGPEAKRSAESPDALLRPAAYRPLLLVLALALASGDEATQSELRRLQQQALRDHPPGPVRMGLIQRRAAGIREVWGAAAAPPPPDTDEDRRRSLHDWHGRVWAPRHMRERAPLAPDAPPE